MKIHDCSDVSIISFAIAMAGSLADIKGVTPGMVGGNDRKRLSMEMSQARQLENSIRIKNDVPNGKDVQILKVFCSTENCYI